LDLTGFGAELLGNLTRKNFHYWPYSYFIGVGNYPKNFILFEFLEGGKIKTRGLKFTQQFKPNFTGLNIIPGCNSKEERPGN